MWNIISSTYVLLLISFGFVNSDPKVPCFFIFGDSYSDAGNNNDLITVAKANYPPYGVDFPGGLATGRFTNGLTIIDIITGLLGIKELIPPFNKASGADILKGVNYASGSAGILPETSSYVGDRIWLARQVQNHETTILELQSFVKGPVSNYLNKCLYSVNIGTNDYVNNYFLPQLSISPEKVLNPDEFATTLVAKYEQLLKITLRMLLVAR
ncbi:GDSL esterase/lipase At5g45670-like isoform X2 [Silene latifolia]|uniref:GDSL esterase/lipase At5g45670-like isoform X2 n=1 Tax=Silene latifolia TaxID=37657 RepID=UPI003D7775B3